MATNTKSRISYPYFRRLVAKMEVGTRARIKTERLSDKAQIELGVMVKYGILVPDPRYLYVESMKDRNYILSGKYLLPDMVYIKCKPQPPEQEEM